MGNQVQNYDYRHEQIFDRESFKSHFMSFTEKAQSDAFLPNKYVSIMFLNQYISLAKTFIDLNPETDFPLRISKQALSGSQIRGMKNIHLRKYSPLAEPLSETILRIFQSGICQHFSVIQTLIDFSVNPNIRTAEKDWSQIINLAIVKIFFVTMLITYLIGLFELMVELYWVKYGSPFSKCGKSSKKGMKYFSFGGVLLISLCHIIWLLDSGVFSSGSSFGKFNSID